MPQPFQNDSLNEAAFKVMAEKFKAGVAIPEPPRRPITGGLLSQRCPHCGREI